MIYLIVPCVFGCHAVVSLRAQVHYGDQIFEPVNPGTLHTFDCCDIIQVTPTWQGTSQLTFWWQHHLLSFFLRCNDSGPTNCCCLIDCWSHVFNTPPSISKDVASNCQDFFFFFGVLFIFLWVVTCGTKPWASSHWVPPFDLHNCETADWTGCTVEKIYLWAICKLGDSHTLTLALSNKSA